MKCYAPIGLLLITILGIAGCVDETNVDVQMDASVDLSTDAAVQPDTRVCVPVQSKQPVPARAAAIKGAPSATDRTVYVDDLFNMVATHCGGCHVDVGLGNFQTSRGSFSDDVNQDWVDSIRYNNVKTVMPPPSVGGKLAKDRPLNDPVNELADLLQAWVNQGRPRDLFHVPPETTEGPYRLDSNLAKELTNIGSCLPEKALYATEKAQMADLDSKFFLMDRQPAGTATAAERIGLPVLLSDTDLTTFDSRELAKFGVISYAPAYPQWVDPDSRSMRHVRVPLGTSVTFDSATQQFTIPPGTRFYRTQLQRIKDKDGTEKWRKMETQLIVSWPNTVTSAGRPTYTSLFGTYAWNDDESQAKLVTDPYRNGDPFRDRIVTYVSDEPQAEATLAKNPLNASTKLHSDRAIRSYAIAGAWRCGQCHFGSATKNFAVGFTPLQIARRKLGEGGVLDDVSDDELSQLTRFIDYGLVAGLSSSDEVVGLEKSEGSPPGSRTPRNNYELKAQAYLLGNCAHCHNPGGEATLSHSDIDLDFLPSSTGGIFQFKLDRYSTRVMRAGGGPSPSVQMPYITPSLMDMGVSGGSASTLYWNPKCSVVNFDDQLGGGMTAAFPIMAPWRSLIYRSVDTPFTYSDDLALMLHMPMNTQSFDCRAPQIIGDWMVSIPSALNSTTVGEYSVASGISYCIPQDDSVQPYREVTLGHTGYKNAAAAEVERLAKYHNTPVVPTDIHPTSDNPNPIMPSRYNFCPDTFDILDPNVLTGKDIVPADRVFPPGSKILMPADGVPNHAHWVVFDPTLIPGDWAPRRPDWDKVLVAQEFPALTGLSGTDLQLALAAQTAEKRAVQTLAGDVDLGGSTTGATLSAAVATLATTEVPMGLWKAKSGCDFSTVSTVSTYRASGSTPAWIQAGLDSNQLTGNEPVYAVTTGEMVHNLICSNCHGTQADSTGRHASVLSEMTGGRANVTNLRDGLLNPANQQRIFASAPLAHASANDWAARYFAWMALGGTKQSIPRSILAMVANTGVLDQRRPLPDVPNDANMLSSAQNICAHVVPMSLQYLNAEPGVITASEFALRSKDRNNHYSFEGGMLESPGASRSTSLIYSNGDALLWEQVCSIENPAPVHALRVSLGVATLSTDYDLYAPQLYPENRNVVDHLGQVVQSKTGGGIPAGNYFPWCLRMPVTDAAKAATKVWIDANLVDNKTPVPYCPETDQNGAPYITAGGVGGSTGDAHLKKESLIRWTMRGAVNAGLVTFVYLSQLASGDLAPTPAYDQCDKLTF